MTVREAGGRWAKGHTGNPKGGKVTTAADLDLRDLARTHTPLAVRRLAEIAEHSEDDRAVVAACSALLDRGWGKPRQELEHSGRVDVSQADLSHAVETLAARIAEKERG